MIYLFAALGGLLAAGLIFLFLHNTSFETERLTIESENVMRDFTVVQLSDLHGRRYKKSIEKAVRALSPKLIVLTGDMFAEPGEKDEEKKREATLRLFSELSQIAPCYAVFGNHEHRLDDLPALAHDMRASGVHVLSNDVHLFLCRGQRVAIAGLDAAAGRQSTFHTAAAGETQQAVLERLGTVGADALKIVLDHYPENFALQKEMSYNHLAFDVMFAGHAHGGQVRLPGVGGLYAPGQGTLPKFTSGVYGEKPPYLVVSRGLGGHAYLPRVGNRAQIVALTITPKKS